jgi:hypothetical protein
MSLYDLLPLYEAQECSDLLIITKSNQKLTHCARSHALSWTISHNQIPTDISWRLNDLFWEDWPSIALQRPGEISNPCLNYDILSNGTPLSMARCRRCERGRGGGASRALSMWPWACVGSGTVGVGWDARGRRCVRAAMCAQTQHRFGCARAGGRREPAFNADSRRPGRSWWCNLEDAALQSKEISIYVYFCGFDFMGDCVDFFTVFIPGKANKV